MTIEIVGRVTNNGDDDGATRSGWCRQCTWLTIPDDWAAGLAIAPETGAAWPELAAMQVKRTPASDNPTKRFIEFLPWFAQALNVASLRLIVQPSFLHARLGGRIPLHVGHLSALGLGLRRICRKRRSRDAEQKPRDNCRAEKSWTLCFLPGESFSPNPNERCAQHVAAGCPQPYGSV